MPFSDILTGYRPLTVTLWMMASIPPMSSSAVRRVSSENGYFLCLLFLFIHTPWYKIRTAFFKLSRNYSLFCFFTFFSMMQMVSAQWLEFFFIKSRFVKSGFDNIRMGVKNQGGLWRSLISPCNVLPVSTSAPAACAADTASHPPPYSTAIKRCLPT